MSGVTPVNDTEFDTEVIQADRLVLVYFWASWCGPCRLMSPLVEWAAENYSDRLKVVKMEVDPNPAIIKLYKVEGVPALRLFHGDRVIANSEGAVGKQKLVELIEPYLEGLETRS